MPVKNERGAFPLSKKQAEATVQNARVTWPSLLTGQHNEHVFQSDEDFDIYSEVYKNMRLFYIFVFLVLYMHILILILILRLPWIGYLNFYKLICHTALLF